MLEAAYIEALLGDSVIHVPMNFIVQQMGETDNQPAIIAAAQSRGPLTPRLFCTTGVPFTHTLILGDVFIRPRLVIGTNHLQGHGMAGLCRFDVSPEEWLAKGTVLRKS